MPDLCIWCNKEIANTEGWSDLAVGLAQVGCFFAGCHVDTEANVIKGPTHEEYATTAVLGAVNPMGGAGQPIVRGTQGAVSKFTSKFTNHIDDFIAKVTEKFSKTSFGNTWRAWFMTANIDNEVANNLLIYHTDDAVEGVLRIGPPRTGDPSDALRLFDLEAAGGEAAMVLVKAAAQESLDRGYGGRMFGYATTEEGR